MKLAKIKCFKLLFVGFLALSQLAEAQVATFSFAGSSGDETTFAVDAQPTNATVSEMSRGSGLTAYTFSGGFNAYKWGSGSTVDLNDYYEFTVVPDAGYDLTLTSLVFDSRYADPMANDTYYWTLRSSLDNFTTDIQTPTGVPASQGASPATQTNNTVDLTGGPFDNFTSPVTFRLYVYDVTNSDNFEWAIDNANINGTVNSPSSTIIEAIDFETVNYTLNSATTLGGLPATSFFDVFAASDENADHALDNGPLTGTQGNNYLAYRNDNNIGSRNMVNTTSIDVSSYENLELAFSLAATSGSSYEDDDILLIEYQFDGNGYQFLTQWAGNSSGNVLLSEDADQTGGGDGVAATELGTTFKPFIRSIPKAGKMLDVRFTVITSIEDAVIDNIAILGTADATNPSATVSISQNPIRTGNLTQTVTVTYDESMDTGTSPSITFATSTYFTSNSDGAWSTTTFANDTWTESFTHNGTAEEIAAETVSIASASGATDLAGNDDVGDTSPAFVVDTDAPAAAVTINTDPVKTGALTQTVTVTYDQTMNTGTNPAITFGTSTSFSSNSDGAWSTTTFANDTWTESFTHNGTNEQVNNEVVSVANASGATDPNGNNDIGDDSPSFVVDTKSPTTTVTISTAPININNLTQTVTVSYDESMDNGTSPVIAFANSGNFTSNSDGAWSTTTFANDTWTESFTHDGTPEEIAADMVTVAAASGAKDLVGQDESGDDSPSFVVDTKAPSATVTVDTNPINTGNLTQTVTVTYDESMDNGTSPTISFATSTNFTSNSDGAWSTTTFTNDTWTESFTHDGTPEEIAAETVSIASTSGATDLAGNSDTGDTSPAFVVDTDAPVATVTISTDPIIAAALTQTVTVTYDQTMNTGTSPAITFGTSTNFASNSDGAWSTTTFANDTWTESFTHNGTNEQVNNEMVSVANASGAADPNGNNDIGDDSPSFVVDTKSPTTTVTISTAPININNLTQTVTVSYDEAMDNGTSPVIAFANSGNLTSNSDGAWSTTTFANDTWTESFTHDGTPEEIAADMATVAAASGAQDLVGQDESGDDSPSFVVDTKAPAATVTVDTNPINTGNLTQTVTVTYDESMDNGTSPTIAFATSTNFTSNSDGAWSTTTFANDTWTESFTHNGTAEEIAAETVSIASASGATDLAGNSDIGDTSPAFVVDTDVPTATVTVNTDPVNVSNMVQTVTVTYDQSMSTGTSPAISFGTSSNFVSNADGAWSTTSFANDTWTESFTHNATPEYIAAEMAAVSNNSGAKDPNGNVDVGDASPAFVVDTEPPFLAPNEISLESSTSITFTLSEELNKSEGASLSGFSTSNGVILSVKYSGKGSTNTVTLTALLPWNSSTKVSYTSASGNVLDLAGNELQDFGPMTVTFNVVNLAAGDIAFTGYLGDNDMFSFVLLKDLEANTKIKFTDNGVLNDNSFTTAEHTISWVTSTRLFAGTEVVISPGLTASIGTVSGLDLDFGVSGGGTDGDQVLAYQGSSSNPTFLAALQMNGNWDSFTDANNKEKSNVPPGLTDGIDAIAINSEKDNATYDYAANGRTGDPASLRTLINGNDSNWGSDNNPGDNDITFPTAGDNYIIPPDVVSLNPVNGGKIAANQNTLSVTFDDALPTTLSSGADVQFKKDDGTVLATFNIGGKVTVSGNTLTIDISSLSLTNNEVYEVDVAEWIVANADGNHNTSIVGDTDWKFTADTQAPTLNPVSIASNNSTSSTQAKVGDVITLSFIASEALNAVPVVALSSGGVAVGGPITVNDLGSNMYSATYTVQAGDTDGNITFTIDYTDEAGNDGSQVISTTDATNVEFDKTLPLLTSVSISSNNTVSSTKAKIGNVVTLTFKASESLSATPVVNFSSGGAGVAGAVVVNSLGGDKYSATYTTQGGDTEGNVTSTIDFVDDAGNDGAQVTAVTDASIVEFDKTAPAINTLGIASNNATNSAFAKGGDVITITFETFEPLSVSSITANSITSGGTSVTNAASANDLGGNVYSVTFTADAGDTDGLVAFSISYTDLANNSAGIAETDITDASSVAMDNTNPAVVSIVADDANPNNTQSVDYTVTFNEDVSGLDATDFSVSLASIPSATVDNTITPIAPNQFTVTVNNFDLNDNVYSGLLRLNFITDGTVIDHAGASTASSNFGGTIYTIIHPEPAEDVPSLSFVSASSNSITVNWTKSVINQLPNRYLIMAKESGSFPAVNDGSFIGDDTDISDGIVAYNINFNTALPYTITGLNSGKSYDIIIYPHTNDGANVDYKTDVPATLTASTTTASSSTITFNSSAASFPATTTALTGATPPQLNAISNFSFIVKDDGASDAVDNAPMTISDIIITQGTGNAIADWTTILAGAELSDETGNTLIGTVNTTDITFAGIPSGDEQLGEIDDNEQKTYTLKVWLHTNLPDDTDTKNLVFKVNESGISFNNPGGSSTFATNEEANSGDTNNKIEVSGEKFTVVQSPETIEGVNTPFNTAPIFEIRDANNNLDLDYTGTYKLTTPEANIDASGVIDDFAGDGQLILTKLRYTSAGDGTLTIIDPDNTGIVAASATTTSVTVINTTLGTLDIDDFPPQNTTSLQSAATDQTILGFVLTDSTTHEVNLTNISINFSKDTTDIFENIRLYRVVNPDKTNPVIDVDYTLVPGVSMDPGSTADSIVFTGFNEVIDTTRYVLVADVSSSAYAGSGTITVSVSAHTSYLQYGDGSMSGSATSPAFNFQDSKRPFIIVTNPVNKNTSTPYGTTDFIITFDEDVKPNNPSFELRRFDNDNLVSYDSVAVVPFDGTEYDKKFIVSFLDNSDTPIGLNQGTKYYITLQQQGFKDPTGNLNLTTKTGLTPAENDITNKGFWSFTTTDIIPPNFIFEVNNNELIENTYDIGFDIKVKLDEPGIAYALALDDSDPDPVDFDTFKNNVNTVNVTVEEAENYYYLNIRGLPSSNNSYHIYVGAEDQGGNQMNTNAFPSTDLNHVQRLTRQTDNPFTDMLSDPVIQLCTGEFQEITAPIIVIENADNAFKDAVGYKFDLVLPSGYFFNTSAGVVEAATTGNISTGPTLTYRNNTTASVNFKVDDEDERDEIRIYNLQIKVDETATNGEMVMNGNIDGIDFESTAATLEVSSKPEAEFTLTPSNEVININSAGPVFLEQVNPIDPFLGESYAFMGDGVSQDTLYANIAGVGTHKITLTQTFEGGCQAIGKKEVEIISEKIDGLDFTYCSGNGDVVITSSIDDPNSPFNGYDLEELNIDVDNIDAENQADLTNSINGFTFSPKLANPDSADFVALNFNAKYKNRANANDSILVNQRVRVFLKPIVSLKSDNLPVNDNTVTACQDFGDIIFRGSPTSGGNTTGTYSIVYNENGTDQSGEINLNSDGSMSVNTNDLAANIGVGKYTVTYLFDNGVTTCDGQTSLQLNINPKPIASFQDANRCIDKETQFTSTSNFGSSTGTIATYNWTFDDVDNNTSSNQSTDQNPTHRFITARTYNVELTVTSDQGCSSDAISQAVEVGANPKPNFTFNQIGKGISTTFDIDETQDLGVPLNQIASVQWTYDERDGNAPTSDIINSSIEAPHEHLFTALGVKNVTLSMTSNNGCTVSTTDSLFIVPIDTITNGTNYLATFETGAAGWVTWGTNNSWVISNTGGDIINNSVDNTSGRTEFWVTGADTYDENQKSYVYSPIFDLTNLSNPLLAMDVFSNIKNQTDGAVIEYSTNGYFGPWLILGEALNDGINWYETRDITNSAGDTNKTNLGWSKEDTLWREAKHSLSKVEGTKVQFRVSFKSGTNGGVHQLDGFAFDNFLIGQRTRSVLLESFTNNNGPSIVASEASTLETAFTGEDVVKINYHTDFPTSETINSANRVDPSARALYYNIDEVPRTVMDGIIYQDSPFSEWGEKAFALRALSLAQFDIQLYVTTQDGALDIAADITPMLPTSGNNVIVTAAVLESTTSDENILRKLLPNAAGIKVNAADITVGKALPTINFSWIPNNVADLNNLSVAVFVQDEMTKEVYQAVIDTAIPTPDQVTGFGDDLADTEFKLYPNPANDQLIVTFSQSHKSNRIQIYDSFGKLVFHKNIEQDDKQLEVNTSEYASGLYQVQFVGKSIEPVIKRLMIVHR